MTEVFDVEETVQLQFSKRFTLPTYVDGPIPQAKSCDLSEPLQFQKQLILLDAELNKTKSLLNGNFELTYELGTPAEPCLIKPKSSMITLYMMIEHFVFGRLDPEALACAHSQE